MKVSKRQLAIYQLQLELDVIKNDMADAMQSAGTSYVAGCRMTPRMDDALRSFYAWAERAKEAGV